MLECTFPASYFTHTIFFVVGATWSQRTFYSYVDEEYYECFTLTVPTAMKTGPGSCNENFIVMNFPKMLAFRSRERPEVEVYIHEAEEPYSELPAFGAVQILIHNDSTTELFLTPELMEFQDKSSAPCTTDSNHSYIKVRIRRDGSRLIFFSHYNLLWPNSKKLMPTNTQGIPATGSLPAPLIIFHLDVLWIFISCRIFCSKFATKSTL